MSLRKHILRFVGHHVECHTYYGNYHGIVVHCTKHHVILAPVYPGVHRLLPPPTVLAAHATEPYRPVPMGPVGPKGPGGWQMAIPLAAILGITALGMHWW